MEPKKSATSAALEVLSREFESLRKQLEESEVRRVKLEAQLDSAHSAIRKLTEQLDARRDEYPLTPNDVALARFERLFGRKGHPPFPTSPESPDWDVVEGPALLVREVANTARFVRDVLDANGEDLPDFDKGDLEKLLRLALDAIELAGKVA